MIAAFFDMDHTLIDGNSGKLFSKYLYKNNMGSIFEVVRALFLHVLYRMNRLDVDGLYDKFTSKLAGGSEAKMAELCERLFRDVVTNLVFPEMRELIEMHRRKEHLLVIISNSTQHIVGPVARHLGMDDFLCTWLEVENGIFTGKVKKPLCYGAGKVYWAGKLADERGVSLKDSYFYTDSITDLDLLKQVKHPVVVNSDSKLRRIAKRRNWPIRYFKNIKPN